MIVINQKYILYIFLSLLYQCAHDIHFIYSVMYITCTSETNICFVLCLLVLVYQKGLRFVRRRIELVNISSGVLLVRYFIAPCYNKYLQFWFLRQVTPQISCIRDLLRSIFQVSTYKAKLKTKQKIGGQCASY